MPMSPVTKPGVPGGPPYVVCLDCGGKFAYNWNEMRMGERIDGPGGDSRGWLARRLRRQN